MPDEDRDMVDFYMGVNKKTTVDEYYCRWTDVEIEVGPLNRQPRVIGSHLLACSVPVDCPLPD